MTPWEQHRFTACIDCGDDQEDVNDVGHCFECYFEAWLKRRPYQHSLYQASLDASDDWLNEQRLTSETVVEGAC